MNAAHNPDRPQPLLLLAIALIGVFAFLQVYSVQAVLPILMHDLQASEVQVGLAVGATAVSSTHLTLPTICSELNPVDGRSLNNYKKHKQVTTHIV